MSNSGSKDKKLNGISCYRMSEKVFKYNPHYYLTECEERACEVRDMCVHAKSVTRLDAVIRSSNFIIIPRKEINETECVCHNNCSSIYEVVHIFAFNSSSRKIHFYCRATPDLPTAESLIEHIKHT